MSGRKGAGPPSLADGGKKGLSFDGGARISSMGGKKRHAPLKLHIEKEESFRSIRIREGRGLLTLPWQLPTLPFPREGKGDGPTSSDRGV